MGTSTEIAGAVSNPVAWAHSVPADEVLVELAKAGNADAFVRLTERFRGFCLGRAYVILRDRAAAEDAAQASWIKAWTHLGSYQSRGSFSAWLGRIVSNQCLMEIRRSRLASLTPIDDAFDAGSSFRLELIDQLALPEETLGTREVSRVLEREISRMPPLLRKVLVMRDMQQMALRDVAATLGVSIAAAKSRLIRARSELRQRLVNQLGSNGCDTLLRKPNRRQVACYRHRDVKDWKP